MSDENRQNQTPKPQEQSVPKEHPKTESKPTELPKPNQGETVTKGG